MYTSVLKKRNSPIVFVILIVNIALMHEVLAEHCPNKNLLYTAIYMFVCHIL